MSSFGNQISVSRHKESKQADNNIWISCQAISCSMAKLSINMSEMNKAFSARQSHQVAPISLGQFEHDVPVSPSAFY
jgi:hypothetical protein